MADNKSKRKNKKSNKSTNKNNSNQNKNQYSNNSSNSDSQPRDYDKDINFADTENASDQAQETTPTSEPLSYNDSTTDQQAVLVDIDDNDDTSGSKALGIIAIVLGILIIAAGFTVYRFFSNQGSVETADTTPVEIIEDGTSDQVASDFEGIVLDDSNDSGTWDELDGVIAHVPFVNRFRTNTDDNGTNDSNGNEENTQEDDIAMNEMNDEDVIMDGINLREIRSNDGNEVSNNSNSIFETTTQTRDDNESIEKLENQEYQNSNTQGWVANNYNFGDVDSGSTHDVVSGDTLWELAEAAYGDGTQWTKIADANNVDYLSNGNPLIIPGQTLTIP